MNTTTINIFKSDNSNIAYVKTYHCQFMTTIAYRILKFESMIKKLIVANHAFFTAITFSKINSFAYINSIVIYHSYTSKESTEITVKFYIHYHLLAHLSYESQYRLYMICSYFGFYISIIIDWQSI